MGKIGSLGKFQDNMYLAKTNDEKIFALKPMNCPGGIQVYNNSIKSYRDLPLRIAEFGKVFRFEPSGALHGLMREFVNLHRMMHMCTALTIKWKKNVKK